MYTQDDIDVLEAKIYEQIDIIAKLETENEDLQDKINQATTMLGDTASNITYFLKSL